ncbi:MAG: hypothetical protein JSS53_10655 [Proteobacteria bacterium]|nr:hypothetical protein [Pseudomonadota bacterium]
MLLKLGLFDLDDCTQDPETLCIKNAALLLPIWLYMTSIGIQMAIVTNNTSTRKNPCNTDEQSQKTRGDEIRDMFKQIGGMGIQFSETISFFDLPLNVGTHVPDYAKGLSDARAQNKLITANGDGGKNLQIKDMMTRFGTTANQTLFTDDNENYSEEAKKIPGLTVVKATTPDQGHSVDYLLELARHVKLDHYAEDLATAIKRKNPPQDQSIQKMMAGFLFILGFRLDLYSKELQKFIEEKLSKDPIAKQQFDKIMNYSEIRKEKDETGKEKVSLMTTREFYLDNLKNYKPADKNDITSFLKSLNPNTTSYKNSPTSSLFQSLKNVPRTIPKGSLGDLDLGTTRKIASAPAAVMRTPRTPPTLPMRSDSPTNKTEVSTTQQTQPNQSTEISIDEQQVSPAQQNNI